MYIYMCYISPWVWLNFAQFHLKWWFRARQMVIWKNKFWAQKIRLCISSLVPNVWFVRSPSWWEFPFCGVPSFEESPFLLLVGMKDSPIVPVVVGVHLLDKVHIISAWKLPACGLQLLVTVAVRKHTRLDLSHMCCSVQSQYCCFSQSCCMKWLLFVG